MSLPPRESRHAAEAADVPADPPPTPVEWLASRSLLDASGALDRASDPRRPPPRSRRTDEDAPPPDVDDLLTTERPAAAPHGGPGYPLAPPPVPGAVGDGSSGHTRLEEILAESGVSPATGGRRRRRYRDDEGPQDDVLSRVLRGG